MLPLLFFQTLYNFSFFLFFFGRERAERWECSSACFGLIARVYVFVCFPFSMISICVCSWVEEKSFFELIIVMLVQNLWLFLFWNEIKPQRKLNMTQILWKWNALMRGRDGWRSMWCFANWLEIQQYFYCLVND